MQLIIEDVEKRTSNDTTRNERLWFRKVNAEDYINKIKDRVAELSLATDKNISSFDYSYQVDEQDQILDPLDPLSFYQSNHICNPITISQIDSINIQLARQSRQ